MEILARGIGPGKITDIFLDSFYFQQKFLLIHGFVFPGNSVTGDALRDPSLFFGLSPFQGTLLENIE